MKLLIVCDRTITKIDLLKVNALHQSLTRVYSHETFYFGKQLSLETAIFFS